MKYTVTVGGRTFDVDLSGPTAIVDGAEVSATLQAVPGTPLRQLVAGARSDLFAMVRQEGGWLISRAGEQWQTEVVDERTRMLREMTGVGKAAASQQVIKAPMPGLVLRVEVEEGQRVEVGAALLVLEAMKMENEIRAQAAGVVRKVHVAAGSPVEKGAALIELGAHDA